VTVSTFLDDTGHLGLVPLTGRGRGRAPHVHPEVEPFWSSIVAGELSLQRCRACRTLRFPLSPVCHNCLSSEFDWEAIDTRGSVNVVIENARPTEGLPRIGLEAPWNELTPYFTGNVDLDCGIRLPGRIVCDCGEARSPGTRVRGVSLETTSDDVRVHGFAHACVVGPFE
jgi:uncharacterized OB-fold protein